MSSSFTKAVLVSAVSFLSAACTAAAPYPGGTPFADTDLAPNREARGSKGFCETYGKQSAADRQRASADAGRGPSGFDMHLAKIEGERGYRRCLSGRTN